MSSETEILRLHREPENPDLVLSAFCPGGHLERFGLSRHDVLWLDEKLVLAKTTEAARYSVAGRRLCPRCGRVTVIVRH